MDRRAAITAFGSIGDYAIIPRDGRHGCLLGIDVVEGRWPGLTVGGRVRIRFAGQGDVRWIGIVRAMKQGYLRVELDARRAPAIHLLGVRAEVTPFS